MALVYVTQPYSSESWELLHLHAVLFVQQTHVMCSR